MARQRGSGARRIGEAERHCEPQPRQPRLDLGDEPLLAAEEMRDAGHVEHQSIGAVERDERREAGAGVGDPLEKLRLGRRIGLDRDERRMARPRIGERQADAEAEPGGAGVDADQALGAFDLGDGDERGRIPARLFTTQLVPAICRQARQPEGEKPPDRRIFAHCCARSGGRFSPRRDREAPAPRQAAP